MITYPHDHHQPYCPPYTRPIPDDHVYDTAHQAMVQLADRRRLQWRGDGAAQVHLLTLLVNELQFLLDEAIRLAADQHVAHADIARIAGISIDQARYIINNYDPDPDDESDDDYDF